jgi:hypothetical protein
MITEIHFSIAVYRCEKVETSHEPTEQELRRIATARPVGTRRQTVDPEAVVVVTCARKSEDVSDLEEVYIA